MTALSWLLSRYADGSHHSSGTKPFAINSKKKPTATKTERENCERKTEYEKDEKKEPESGVTWSTDAGHAIRKFTHYVQLFKVNDRIFSTNDAIKQVENNNKKIPPQT